MKKGIIYRIEYKEDPNIRYIGSTLHPLKYRWRDHNQDYQKYSNAKHCEIEIYPYFKKYGIDNFEIIMIKEYNVCDRKNLEAYEKLWINKLKCCNKHNTLFIKKISHIDYYQKNKDEIKSKVKLYSQENKDKVYTNKKKYNEEHKEDIDLYKKGMVSNKERRKKTKTSL